MKHEFCDCGFEVLKKSGILSIVRCDQVATFSLTVVDPADKRVVEVNVVRITYDVDLEVIHNLPLIAKTNYSSAIRSLQHSSNMKRCPSVLPQNNLVQCHHEGHNGNKDSDHEKEAPSLVLPNYYPTDGHLTLARGGRYERSSCS